MQKKMKCGSQETAPDKVNFTVELSVKGHPTSAHTQHMSHSEFHWGNLWIKLYWKKKVLNSVNIYVKVCTAAC